MLGFGFLAGWKFAGVASGALVLAAAGALPATATPTAPEYLPVNAETLTLVCDSGSTTYVGLSGSLRFVPREGTSASGNTRFGGTVALHNVLVSDGSQTYRAVGAATFNGEGNARTGATSDRGTFHITVLGATGPVAAVRITGRLLDDGSIALNDHGNCDQP